MKKIIFSMLALLTISCSKDFLETEPTETAHNPDPLYKVNGLYNLMIKTETGGTTGADDFGQKGYDIYSDMLSSDMAMPSNTYGWYRDILNYTATVTSSDTENYMPWRYYYRIIVAANEIIHGLGGSDVVPTTDDNKYAMGQAKGMRAYAYFYLLQFFTKEYDADAESIPLYVDEVKGANPLSKQSVVYAQIIKDLESAISLLEDFSRTNKAMLDKNVAKGLLAYTYAAMGDNVNAAKVAQDIIDNSGYPFTTREEVVRSKHNGTDFSGGGFNDLSTKSWMWGFDLTLDNGLDLHSWWGQVDVFTYSYAAVGDVKVMDENLYNSIRQDDIRKEQFAGVLSGIKYLATNKFFAPERKLQGQREVETDYIFMRVDEFHLLAAEALAKSGEEVKARDILKKYLSTRITDVTYIDNLSGTALTDEIYLNTRIEFWGEGKSYLALKRNKKAVTRGANHQYHAGKTFNYNDERLTYTLPDQETLNNPHF